jgi:hypothetical protein
MDLVALKLEIMQAAVKYSDATSFETFLSATRKSDEILHKAGEDAYEAFRALHAAIDKIGK